MEEEEKDILMVQEINSKGFGMIPKLVMQDKKLSVQAKAIYAYFCSYAGSGKTAFPRRTKILADLSISKETYYKHFTLLKDCGYIQCEQERKKGKFERNIYTLMQKVEHNLPCPRIPDTEKRDTVNQDTDRYKKNKIKKNSFKKNSQSSPEDEQDRTELTKLTELIQHNISYSDLKLTNEPDIGLIDEMISIILDVLLSKGETIYLAGESKPRELVKSSLKLRYENILLVLGQYQSYEGRITKKRHYILTMLYHSIMELNAHYINLVKSDFGL